MRISLGRFFAAADLLLLILFIMESFCSFKAFLILIMIYQSIILFIILGFLIGAMDKPTSSKQSSDGERSLNYVRLILFCIIF